MKVIHSLAFPVLKRMPGPGHGHYYIYKDIQQGETPDGVQVGQETYVRNVSRWESVSMVNHSFYF